MQNDFIKLLDSKLGKKSKRYFLWKKIRDYQKRTHYQWQYSIHKVIKYEKGWRYMKRKYAQINIYEVKFCGIGETIPRLFMYVKDDWQRNKNIYNIVLPGFYNYYKKEKGLVNSKILDIFKRNINFVTRENISFWLYVVVVHSRDINIDYFDQYKFREAVSFSNLNCKPFIPFFGEMVKYAQKKMKEMGIDREYICFHAREELTKKDNFIGIKNSAVASVDIDSFRQAYNYLHDLGYQTVRMGKDERRKCKFEDTIDYANGYYDEFMDFYLIANCKFLIGSPSGLTIITPFWGRPILMTNLNVFSYGFEEMPYTQYDLHIPKKFYSKSKKRLLNLYEMITINNKCDRYTELYNRERIEVIDNTEEEILQATIEMNEKLNHTWETTEEEKQCMDKYWQIIELWRSRHPDSWPRRHASEEGCSGYVMPPMPICYSYLKDNLYLLDVEMDIC